MTARARRAWFADSSARGFPVLVADDATARSVGVASYGDFRDTAHWEGYRFTVELSIHVRADRRGAGDRAVAHGGAGRRARAAGRARDGGGGRRRQRGSIRFHERLGFVEVARMPETGFKFGRWLDLVLLQRILTRRDPGHIWMTTSRSSVISRTA